MMVLISLCQSEESTKLKSHIGRQHTYFLQVYFVQNTLPLKFDASKAMKIIWNTLMGPLEIMEQPVMCFVIVDGN